MFEKVLVPVDLSIKSRYVLNCLKHIPGLREVVILHVAYNRYPANGAGPADPDLAYRKRCLDEIQRGIEVPGVTVRTVTEEIPAGEIFEVIDRVAAREGIPLAIMGRRGRGIIDSLLLGSVASDVLRYGRTDLLLINNRRADGMVRGGVDPLCPDLFSHALICTDFSDPDPASFCREELPFIQEVTLFHAVTTGDTPEEVRSSIDAARAALGSMADTFAGISIPAHVQVSVGSAAEEIIACSEQQGISVIILKSTGKRGFLQNLVGSTSARVARHAEKPVLVLKSCRSSRQ